MTSKLHTEGSLERFRKILPWLWLLGCFAVINIFLSRYMTQLLDSDLAAEIILAKHLASKGFAIMDSEWVYSTEIKLLSAQLIYSNLARFISGWHDIRIVGDMLTYLVFLLCFYYFCRQTGLKDRFPIAAGMLMLPFSSDYFMYVLRGIYYIPVICISLVLFGMVIKAVSRRAKYQWIELALIALLSFAAGAQGLRQTLVFTLPLVFCSLVMLSLSLKDELQTFSENLSFKTLLEHYKLNPNLRFFCISVFTLVTNVAGIYINSAILPRYYWFRSYNSMLLWIFPDSENVFNISSGLLSALGFRTGKSIFSGATLCNVISVLIALMLIICTVRIIKRFKTQSFESAAVVLFNASAVVIYTLLFLFTDLIYNNRYNLPIVVFVIPVLMVYLTTLKVSSRWRSGACVLLCAMFLVLGARNYSFYKENDIFNAFQKEEISEYLTANGYSNGYASFWNANVLTEMSEGQLEVWCLEDDATDLSRIYWWLQKLSHMETIPEGKLFFLTTAAERDGKQVYSLLEDDHLIYKTEGFLVYGYDSYDALPAGMKPAADQEVSP